MRRAFRVLATSNAARVSLLSGACLCSAGVYLAASPVSSVPPVVVTQPRPVISGETKEPFTGCTFPNVKDGLDLLGVGLRTKYSFFSVYAYALYAERKFFEERSANEVFTRLINGGERKLLLLRFQREITGEELKDALKTSLEPRWCNFLSSYSFIYSSRVDAASHPQLQVSKLFVAYDSTHFHRFQKDFFSQFPGLKLANGTELQFDISDDKIVTFFQGERLKTVVSKPVATALLDVYLGAHPISTDFAPSIKKTLSLK
jgi:hypothetical protein